MSLFPAYIPEDSQNLPEDDKTCNSQELVEREDYTAKYSECYLLKSSSSEDECVAPPAPAAAAVAPSPDFYSDRRMDRGNIHVSTLYYPARPQYIVETHIPLGRKRKARDRPRRYYRCATVTATATATSPEDIAQVAARAADMRAYLARCPRDQDAWLRYIEYQLEWNGAGDALDAARDAATRCSTRRVRDALHAARLRHLTLDAVLDELRRDAVGGCAATKREAWLRLVEAGAGSGPEAAQSVAAAALSALAPDPLAYPRVLAAHAGWLAAAGLWERLTLLIELVAAMNFPPSPIFPPPRDPAFEASLEAELLDREEKVVNSGLPSNVVWTRVERLRAAAHWRSAAEGDADPQRYVAPADVAELLRAAAPALLRGAGVPPLPAAEHAARALPPGLAAPVDAPLVAAALRAARRLPPPYSPAPDAASARSVLAPLLDPPHYFTDRTGFLRWVNALWEACCGWFAGRQRLALVCWRLRWLHMLARLAEGGEARRLRGEARAVLRRLTPDAPVAFAHFARIEREVQGAAARRAALQAARAALRPPAPPEDALFAARVLAELSAAGAPDARWALCCAALGRELPPDAELVAPPPPAVERAARAAVEERCERLERDDGAEDEDEEDETVEEALLPGAGEWAAARVALQDSAAARRALAAAAAAPAPRRRLALRYREAEACALVLAAARDARLGSAANALLPRFPSNASLAMGAAGGRSVRAWIGSHVSALAAALRGLAAAGGVEEAAARAGARRAARACGRAAPWGGAALAAWGAEAGARGGGGAGALLAALGAAPHCKWAWVRAAALLPAESARLVDAVLERELRLHALPDELRPLSPRR